MLYSCIPNHCFVFRHFFWSLHYGYMWPDFGKSVLMSHLTTQIFMTKLRRRDIQTTLQWLQFVVQTLNYQKLCEIIWKFFYPLTYGHIELCNFVYFNVTLGLIFQNRVTYSVTTVKVQIFSILIMASVQHLKIANALLTLFFAWNALKQAMKSNVTFFFLI